jgi:hypothetical protein
LRPPREDPEFAMPDDIEDGIGCVRTSSKRLRRDRYIVEDALYQVMGCARVRRYAPNTYARRTTQRD